MSGEITKENIIILNPLWSVNSGGLVIEPNIASFGHTMNYIEQNREKIHNIMMFVDVPPRIHHAEQLFTTRSEARNHTRRHLGMRNMGQFSQGIQNYYLPHLPDSVRLEDIRILTETFVREIVVNLPDHERIQLPQCRNTKNCTIPNGKKSAGCLEITIASFLFALDPEKYEKTKDIFDVKTSGTSNKLQIFAEISNRLPGEYVVEGAHHLPEGSAQYTIINNPQ